MYKSLKIVRITLTQGFSHYRLVHPFGSQQEIKSTLRITKII